MNGVVEATRELAYGPRRFAFVCGWVRGADGQRYFVHPSDLDGTTPRRFDRVAFDPDREGDPKGFRARNVTITQAHVDHDATYADCMIVCSECGEPFLWTAAEQAFYRSKRLNPPKKDRTCRRLVRERLGLPIRTPFRRADDENADG